MSQSPGSGVPCPGFDLNAEIRDVYLRYALTVRRHAARAALGDYQLAEDATQEAFAEAVRAWPGLREMPASGQLAWLSKRACWRVIDGWRSARAVFPAENLPEEPSPQTAEDAAVSAVSVDRFWKVVTTMPQRAARAAYLSWHEGWTKAAIAAYLGVDRATVHRDLKDVAAKAFEQLADEPGLHGPGSRKGDDSAAR